MCELATDLDPIPLDPEPLPAAVIGPPWRAGPLPPGEAIAADPTRIVAKGAWAAFSPALGRLERAPGGEAEAAARADCLATEAGAGALILKGALGLASGRWIWIVHSTADAGDVVDVEKQDPRTRSGFAEVVTQRARALERKFQAADRRALRSIRRLINQPWADMSPSQRSRFIENAADEMAGVPRDGGIQQGMRVLVNRAEQVANRTFGGRMPRDMRRDIRRIVRSMLDRVVEEYAERGRRFEVEAEAVADRAAAGELTSREATTQIRALANQRMARTPFYASVVANAVIGRARSAGRLLRAIADDNVTRLVWKARRDSKVCNVCRFLHNTIIGIEAARSQFERAATARLAGDPDRAMRAMPWYQIRGDEIRVTTGERAAATDKGRVGRIIESGVGRPNNAGRFEATEDIERAGGTLMPPAHGLCRCDVQPVRGR